MNKTNEFVIVGRLPTRNEEINACRQHWAVGAKLKSNAEKAVIKCAGDAMERGKLRKVKKPCYMVIVWHEKTNRRDVDNVQSGVKYILDALQKLEVLENDNRKFVRQVESYVVQSNADFIEVRIFESYEEFVEETGSVLMEDRVR